MICIKAGKRSANGSYAACSYRKEGMIPANFYGNKIKNINLVVSQKEIASIKSKKESSILFLDIEGQKRKVILKDIQYHPVTLYPLHVDFFAVNDAEKVRFSIPIRYLNTDKCVGIKRGGYLNKIYRRLPLICLPAHAPESIDIDTMNFNIGDVVKVGELNLSGNIRLLRKSDVIICNITGRAKKEEVDQVEESTDK